MKLDRELQLHILRTLRDVYPGRDSKQLFADVDEDSNQEAQLIANLAYLEEHGMASSGLTFSLSGSAMYSGARITAAGLDFLEDDGGLSAIRGTVIVKLHADTIRDLMLAKVEASALPTEEKSKFKKAISTLSTEAIKEATKRLVTAGMDNAPDAIAFLRSVLSLS